MDIGTILTIVRAEESREIVHCVGVVIALSLCILPAAALLYRRFFRRFGIVFALIMAGFLYSMATKPDVTFDSYIENNGSHFTNEYTKVVFKWAKKSATLSDTTPLYIAQKPSGGTSWEEVVETTVGVFTYELAIASTNYAWYIYTDYVPPTPVHTNGIWVGNVIEKAKGDTGLNRIVPIKSQLIQDGKVLAP